MKDAKQAGPVRIRQATLDDVPALAELLAVLFTQENEFAPDPALQENALRQIIQRPDVGQIYCAIVDGQIVGMVSLLFTISTAEGGMAAWLEDMVVTPPFRGRHIGESLLRHAIEDARKRKCRRITLLTDTTNAGAIRFYARAGFKASQMMPLRLKLARPKNG